MLGHRKTRSGRQSLERRPSRTIERSPATFSYYASDNRRHNRADGPSSRGTINRRSVTKRTQVLSRLSYVFKPSQLPLLGLVVVAVVSVIKISLLNANPKVVFVTPAGASTRYVQDDGVYAAAVTAQLTRSPLNRFKLIADVNGIQDRLARQFPELDAVSIDVPLLGNRPLAYLTIAAPSLDLSVAGQQFRLNDGGVVLARTNGSDRTLPVIEDGSGRIPSIGTQALPASTVSFATAVVYQLTKSGHLQISSIDLPKAAPYELTVRITGKSYYIRYNLRADAVQQSGAAIAAIQKLGGSAPAQYVDVRVPGRVYYK